MSRSGSAGILGEAGGYHPLVLQMAQCLQLGGRGSEDKVVRRRQDQRRLQLPGPARARPEEEQGRNHLGGGRRTRGQSPSRTSNCYNKVCKFANVLKSKGNAEGRPRLHLHAHDPRAGGRHAGHAPGSAPSTASSSEASRRNHYGTGSTTATARCSSPPTAITAAESQ